MATDAEIRRLRQQYSAIITRLEQISRSVTAKVSSEDVSTLLRDVQDLIETYNDRITSLENYYDTLNSAVSKLLLASPTVIYPTIYAAPDAAAIVTTVTAGLSNSTTYTPDFPRRASVSFSAATSGEYVTITGTDIYGTLLVESVEVGNDYTLFAFRSITNIDATNITSGTVTIGWSNWLSINCSRFTSIIEERVDGTIETVAGYDEDYGVVIFGTLPNGSRDYEVVVVI